MIAKVEVLKDLCIGSGKCVNEAPEAFVFDDLELAEATPAAPALSEDRLRAIARRCPVSAIVLYDEAGNELVP